MKDVKALGSTAKDATNRLNVLLSGVEFCDSLEHLRLLVDMAEGNVVEIGTDIGNTTSALLTGVQYKGGYVYSIDINPTCARVFEGNPHWKFILGNSYKDADRILPQLPAQFDMLCVDGSHTYEACTADMNIYGARVKPGGLIVIHDVDHPDFPGVRQAFEEYPVGRKLVNAGSWGLGIIEVPLV